MDQTDGDWHYSAQGDWAGLFHICQLFLKNMVGQGSGSIINIASIYGIVSNDPTL